MEKKPVIIIGVNALGKAAKEVFEENGVEVYGFLSDKDIKGEIDEVPILGTLEDDSYTSIIGDTCNAFLAIDEVEYRKQLLEDYDITATNAIHPQAKLSKTASFSYGNFIGMGVILNTLVQVGSHNIIHSGVLLDTETKIGDHVQIGAGSTICANVTIGSGVFIGAGVTIVSGVKIGDNARIGAGSVVIGEVKSDKMVFGNPAKEI